MTVGIVTGAARGMGAACAERMARTVDTLLLVDRDADSLEAAADALVDGGAIATLETRVVDVKDQDAVVGLAVRAAELGSLRAVAHAAGVSPTMAGWREILAVDLVGTALLVDACRPLMGDGAAFVCFASISALLALPDPDQPADPVLDRPLVADFLDRLYDVAGPEIEDPGLAYCWAKRGVHRLVRREAVPFGQTGARICSVTPGIIDTPMGRQESESHSVMDMLVQASALRREGQPEEVAAVVAFLLSHEARYVTGIDVPVDGGVVAGIRSGGVALQ
jgi:NAD(P)-dependent dehydrogenase (short-subunit alcohol dehydrogenase family)